MAGDERSARAERSSCASEVKVETKGRTAARSAVSTAFDFALCVAFGVGVVGLGRSGASDLGIGGVAMLFSGARRVGVLAAARVWVGVLVATAAVLGAGLAWAAGGWRIVPTARQRASLSAISCPSATAPSALPVRGAGPGTRCWAVGFTSNALRRIRPVIELWNGHRWTIQAVSLPRRLRFGGFSDISCTSARFCMAVGAEAVSVYVYRSPYGELWDGRTWKNEPMVSPVKQDVGLAGVSCASRTACVAVGVRYLSPGLRPAGFAQRWNGHDWLTIRAPIVGPSGLSTGLSCMSATACMAGGRPNGPGAQVWNGRRWIPQVIPIPSGIVAYQRSVPFLTALSCPAARRCVGLAFIRTGSRSIAELTATWNGRKWTSAVIPETSAFPESIGTELFGISCSSTRACVAVGGNPTAGLAAVGGNSPDPIAASWNGQTWTVETLPKPADEPSALLHQVSCNSATSCMAIGSSGNEQPTFLRAPLAERYQK
jgi:hypothetical protein